MKASPNMLVTDAKPLHCFKFNQTLIEAKPLPGAVGEDATLAHVELVTASLWIFPTT